MANRDGMMTVRDLIKMLEGEDPELQVRIAQPTHDHWRSIKAAVPRSIEVLPVKRSEYHSADVISSYDEADGDTLDVLVIS
jgi:hypothetical protein